MSKIRDFILALLFLGPFVGVFAVVWLTFDWQTFLIALSGFAFIMWLAWPFYNEDPVTPGNAFQTTRRARYEHNRRA